MRPFGDLIKQIEYEGKVFVPIQRIVALAFNYNVGTVLNEYEMWINDSYDHALHYTFESKIVDADMGVIMQDNFDLWVRIKLKGNESKITTACNQIEIFRSLVKWGFIEL